MPPDPNAQHAEALSDGYDSIEHARAAARERAEQDQDGDESYMDELLDDSCFGVPQSFEEQQ